jgi:hypothetical protein
MFVMWETEGLSQRTEKRTFRILQKWYTLLKPSVSCVWKKHNDNRLIDTCNKQTAGLKDFCNWNSYKMLP